MAPDSAEWWDRGYLQMSWCISVKRELIYEYFNNGIMTQLPFLPPQGSYKEQVESVECQFKFDRNADWA